MRLANQGRSLLLILGACLFGTVQCLPSGDQLRGIVQGSLLGATNTAVDAILRAAAQALLTTS